MGCATSKFETEEVLLCRSRKQLIKQASAHRHTFASSHAAYVSSLKNTGAAISQFAEIDAPASSADDRASSSMVRMHMNQGPGPPPPPMHLNEREDRERGPLFRASSMPPLNSNPSSASKRYNGRNNEGGLDGEDSDSDSDDDGDDGDEDDEDDEDLGDEAAYGDEEQESEKYGSGFQKEPPRTRSLAIILRDIDKLFLDSYKAGHEVSCHYLDAHRDFFHTPFVDERSGIEEHRRQVSRIISWTKSPKEPLVDEQSNSDNLASTLDKLHAWEKKLYDETKALASTTLELTRRKKQLESQEERGIVSKIDKTKNIVKGLETKYFVEYQAITEAQSEVCKLRDSRLVPQLKTLLTVIRDMWVKMYEAHKKQDALVRELCGLKSEAASNAKERSKFCETLTRDLEREMVLLRDNLGMMVSSQREWMEAMVEWLRKHYGSEILGSSPAIAPLLELFRAWGTMLKELPTERALDDLKAFVDRLQEMGMKQQWEVEAKGKVDELEKDLEKKRRALELYELSYLEKNPRQGNAAAEDRDPLQERKANVELIERELRGANEQHQKLCEENSVMMLLCLQRGLPSVHAAITTFAEKCASGYNSLVRDHA